MSKFFPGSNASLATSGVLTGLGLLGTILASVYAKKAKDELLVSTSGLGSSDNKTRALTTLAVLLGIVTAILAVWFGYNIVKRVRP